MILLCWYILISSGFVLRWTGRFISASVRQHKIAKAAQGGDEMAEETYCDIENRKNGNGKNYDKCFYAAG